MQGADYYISDLHLSPDTAGVNALFDVFLDNHARGARSLTINGDLFDHYTGRKQLRDPFYACVCGRLGALVKAGTAVDFTAGNRDFLFVRDARRYGMRGIRNHVTRELGGAAVGVERVTAIHGDVFCLDDKSYLRFRRVMRALPLRLVGACTPRATHERIAARIRAKSREKLAAPKPAGYYDIKDEAVRPFIERMNCGTLVCGHIHQPQARSYALGGRERRMLVLSDWTEQGAVIAGAAPGGKLELMRLTLDGLTPWSGKS